MTHAELVVRAHYWLFERWNCCHVQTEPMSYYTGESPDAIGWDRHGDSYLVECKASVSDFYKDRRKSFRKNPVEGMGQHRIYLTPRGLLKPKQMRDGWGLAEVRKSRIYLIHKPTPRASPNEYDAQSERVLLMRRFVWGFGFDDSYEHADGAGI